MCDITFLVTERPLPTTSLSITIGIMEVDAAVQSLKPTSDVDTGDVVMSTVPDSQHVPIDHIWGSDDDEAESDTAMACVISPVISPTVVKQRLSQFVRKRSPSLSPVAPPPKRPKMLNVDTKSLVGSHNQSIQQGEGIPLQMKGRVCYIDNDTKPSTTNDAARHGTTFICPPALRKSIGTQNGVFTNESVKLFYKLGLDVYLDKPNSVRFYGYSAEDKTLRLSLWFVNNISKYQKSGSKNSVTLDFDQITLIKAALPDIENALKICDTECFLGYALNLDNDWYLTVDKDQCMISIRQWYSLNGVHRYDPDVDLHPGRQGLRLNYDQFRKFRVFLEKHLNEYYPTYKDHVFKCDRPDHVTSHCKVCTPHGRLPLHKYVQNLLTGEHYFFFFIPFILNAHTFLNTSL